MENGFYWIVYFDQLTIAEYEDGTWYKIGFDCDIVPDKVIEKIKEPDIHDIERFT